MGNYWFGNRWKEAVYQWSKGEYAGANNTQDDLTRIERDIPFRDDDISDSRELEIAADGMVDPLKNRGFIGKDDSDEFTFEIMGEGGHAKLHINRTEYIGGSMLDIDAAIVDAEGAEVIRDNPIKLRYVDLDVELPAGSYQLVIRGGAEKMPTDGFSNYSSMDYYAIEGVIDTGKDPDDTPPSVEISSHSDGDAVEIEEFPTMVTFVVAASDADSGLQSISLSIDGEDLGDKADGDDLEWEFEVQRESTLTIWERYSGVPRMPADLWFDLAGASDG